MLITKTTMRNYKYYKSHFFRLLTSSITSFVPVSSLAFFEEGARLSAGADASSVAATFVFEFFFDDTVAALVFVFAAVAFFLMLSNIRRHERL